MLLFVRRLVLIACALTFVSGSIIGLACASAHASEPSTHQHNHGTPSHHHHDADGACCVAFCLGAYVGVPASSPNQTLGNAAVTATLVAYWTASQALAGRTISPDPAPPRTSV